MKLKDISIKIFEYINKYKYLLLVIAVGIVLILIPTGNGGEKENNGTELDLNEVFSIEKEEKRLEELLKKIDKVGNVKVMLTIKSSTETIYAEEKSAKVRRNEGQGEVSSYDQEQNSKPVLVSGGSGKQQALTVKYIYPEYQGVVVVCEGGDNAVVRLKITESLSALLGIGTDRITITKMKN